MKRIIIILAVGLVGCTSWKPTEAQLKQHRITDELTVDPAVEDLILPYRKELEEEMNQVLTYSKVDLTKGKPESSLTNWFVDVLHEAVGRYYTNGADFTIQNYGGIRRSSIGAGAITKGVIYELMPFENRLVILTITGEEVVRLAQKIAKSGGWPVSKEFRFDIVGETANNITVGGQELDLKKSYRMALPDYVANGGDRLGLSLDLPREDDQVLLRDVLIEQIALTDTVHAVELDGRIKIIGE